MVRKITAVIVTVLTLFAGAVAAQEEDEIPGLPTGDSAELPDRVDWELGKDALLGKTVSRYRLRIKGMWRFAAVAEKTTNVDRAKMGWIEMPSGSWHSNAKIYDTSDKFTDGMWGDAKLDSFPYAWAERDIKARSVWIRKRIFLNVRGPWAESEVFSFFEKVPGHKRSFGTSFELTEMLAYPGTTRLSLRASAEAFKNRPPDEESDMWLELVPIGPRVEDIECFRDGENLVADFLLFRPPIFLIQGLSLKNIPTTLKIRVRDADSNEVVLERWADVGKLTEVYRHVRIAMGQIPKGKNLQLSVDMCPTKADVFDVTFPIKFDPAQLKKPPVREKIELFDSKEPIR